jgi:hypothetical protein
LEKIKEAAHFVGPTDERQKVTFYIKTYKHINLSSIQFLYECLRRQFLLLEE